MRRSERRTVTNEHDTEGFGRGTGQDFIILTRVIQGRGELGNTGLADDGGARREGEGRSRQ